MNNEIAEYIQTEKEISEYNISILKRGEQNSSKKRLIKIEEEFCSISFENMGLKTLSQAEECVSTFRESRALFYSKYKNNESKELYRTIVRKITFLEKLSYNLMRHGVEETNPVQDSFFFEKLKNYLISKDNEKYNAESLPLKSLEELVSIEPAKIAKERARTQAGIYSLGLYIINFIDKELNFSKEINSNLNYLNLKIDQLVYNLEDHIFCNYNKTIQIFSNNFHLKMGENKYIDKIYTLENIFSHYKQEHACTHVYIKDKNYKIDLSSPKIGNLYYGIKNPISESYHKDMDKKYKSKTYGILFPVERKSREKMTALHASIKHCGIDITELFCKNISNIKVLDDNNEYKYYKGILMKPLWELLNYASKSIEYHYIVSKILDESIQDISNFNNKEYIDIINKKKTPFLDIDISSELLVPRTRSEENYIESMLPILNKKIENIKEDFRDII